MLGCQPVDEALCRLVIVLLLVLLWLLFLLAVVVVVPGAAVDASICDVDAL